MPGRASRQETAKLSWSKPRRRKSGGRAGKDFVLTWGDPALRLKGRRGPTAEREVSRGHSSRTSGEGPNGEEGETDVSLEGKRPQMSGQPEQPRGSRGEAPKAPRCEEEPTAASDTGRPGASARMERVLAPANLKVALARVRKNKGSPGVDGMSVEDLPGYLREHWERIRSELLAGTFQPQCGASEPLLRRAGASPARSVTSTLRTARCGPACRVVWQGTGGDYPPPLCRF
jgi:RNA-directed DNA polymerase